VPCGYASYSREEWLAFAGPGPQSQEIGLAPGDVPVYSSLAGLIARRAGPPGGPPYLIGIAGAVAAGKSTAAGALQVLLAEGSGPRGRPVVEAIATDGFLFANDELLARGILSRKGFPESYDTGRLVRFLSEVKAGRLAVEAPVYSHETYDIVPGRVVTVCHPDFLVVEGVNVLQDAPVVALLDFSIYVDADAGDLERWYVERFLLLTRQARSRPGSFYGRFAGHADDAVAGLAREVWRGVNAVNLEEHIAPTRCRADLILEKGPDHAVRRIRRRAG
jgi:type I pantothenate kinase